MRILEHEVLNRWVLACELMNKVRCAALVAAVLCAAPAAAIAQEHAPAAQQPAESLGVVPADELHEQTELDHAGEEEHGGVLYALKSSLWPAANFIVLVGILYYFGKDPVSAYLKDRKTTIGRDLVEAAALRSTATAQLEQIDQKLKSLPAELDALRRRGSEEIAAEEARIAHQAATERERLVEQTRREIELQVRIAKRDLTDHAADLAVALASDRITQEITPADQQRLVDRYVDQLGKQ